MQGNSEFNTSQEGTVNKASCYSVQIVGGVVVAFEGDMWFLAGGAAKHIFKQFRCVCLSTNCSVSSSLLVLLLFLSLSSFQQNGIAIQFCEGEVIFRALHIFAEPVIFELQWKMDLCKSARAVGARSPEKVPFPTFCLAVKVFRTTSLDFMNFSWNSKF